MSEDEFFEMRVAYQLTDEGLAAWLYGLVDQLLSGDTLKPAEGDTPKVLAMKGVSRHRRDAAMKMLEHLSGLDDLYGQLFNPDGPRPWPSRNALSHALTAAMMDGIAVAEYVAPHPEMDEAQGEAVANEIQALIQANPALREIVEEFNDLHGEEDDA